MAFANVRSNLLRSLLTTMIIAFGIMALVGILTAIDSILMSMTNNFSGLGANSFAISRKGENFRRNDGGRQSKVSPPITFDQAVTLQQKNKLPTKISISGAAAGAATVIFDNKKTDPNITVIGINENYLDINAYELSAGRPFSANEFLYGVNVCLLGSEMVKKLFNGRTQSAIDKVISVGGDKFRIVGVLSSQGSSMNSSVDKQIEIPLLTQKKLYGYSEQNYNVAVGIPVGANLQEAIDYTTGLFRTIRKLRVIEEDDFEIEKSDAIMEILEENTVTLRLATIGIGMITLLGAAIGLMNIMLVSVTERTREIGIRKALGATKNNILVQFLVEAIIICQIGGIIGIFLGILAGNSISIFMNGAFIIPWAWIIMGIITCLLVGLISGIYPAMKAARLDPVESLRYE